MDEEVLPVLLKEAVLVNVVAEMVRIASSFFASFSKIVMNSTRQVLYYRNP